MIRLNSNAIRHIQITTFILLAISSFAQNNIQWGELNEEKHKIFLDLQWIGQTKANHDQLWLKRNKYGYSLEQLDNALSTVNSHQLLLDSIFPDANKRSFECYILSFHNDTTRLLIGYKSLTKQKNNKAITLDVNGKIIGAPVPIFEGSKTQYTKLSISSDSSRFTLLQISKGENNQHLHFLTFSRTLQLINDYTTELSLPDGYTYNNTIISTFEIDIQGNFIVERELYAKNSDISDKTFWLINPRENKITEITPKLGNATIESAAITNTAHGTRISGLYFMNDIVPDPKKPSHLFYLEVDDQTMTEQNLQTYPCSLVPVSNENNKDVFAIDYSYSLPKKDGGIFLFIERLIVEKKSGRRHTTTFGVANFDKAGKQIYFSLVARRQSYWFGPFANAYGTLPVYDSASHLLHLIFNDHENNLSENQPARRLRNMKHSTPVMCSLDETGKISKRRLQQRDKEGPVLSIAWSHQVAPNKMLMVGMEEKGYRMGWLTLDEVKGRTVANRYVMPTSPTEPRRQTSRPAPHFNKSDERKFVGSFDVTFGTVSKLPPSISNWLTQNGYPTRFGLPDYDGKMEVLLISRALHLKWGLEVGGNAFHDNKNFYETYGGLSLWKSAYLQPISSNIVFSLTFGISSQEIAFTKAPLPYDKTKFGDFQLNNFSYYLGTSIKLLKPTKGRFEFSDKNGTVTKSLATGIEAGMRIYLWREHWQYKDNYGGQYPAARSMPQINQVNFYINIPMGLLWQRFR